MHILQAQTRRIDDGEDAVDLGQSAGDIVILTAADTEISGFAAARAQLGDDFPSLRIANIMALSHPYSIDLYAENTLCHAKLIVVRLLGGRGYWPYGLERLSELANANGTKLIVVPGDANWDVDLENVTNTGLEPAQTFWRYCLEGGADNLRNALLHLAGLIGIKVDVDPPRILPKAGLYWPKISQPKREDIEQQWCGNELAAIVFYRSTVQANAIAPIDALIEALVAEGVNALPIYVSSLKDPESVAFLHSVLGEQNPSVVLNGTAFAVSKAGVRHSQTPLDTYARAVLQFVMSGTSQEGWRDSDRGLSVKDLTMHVVLPEIDGRILSQVISFKEQGTFDALSECTPVRFVPLQNRVERLAQQATKLARLGSIEPSAKKIGVILSNYPNKDGRLANGVGLDTPASAIAVMQAMGEAGYDVSGMPENDKALMDLLMAGPTNAFDRERLLLAKQTLSKIEYTKYFSELPKNLQEKIYERWGAIEDDPMCLNGAFRLPVHRFGNVVIAIQPARGYNIDPKETYHDPALVPPHNYLAFYMWMRHEFGANALIHLGKHGNLEWLPGKALALSEECWPDAILGDLPLVYPFIINDPGEGSQAKRRNSAVIIDHLMPAMTRAESYGPLSEIEALIDEYFLAQGVDSRRVKALEKRIFEAIERHHLEEELGLSGPSFDRQDALLKLDGYICELKEAQIRDGLHTFGSSPFTVQRIDTLVALCRIPGIDRQSFHRAIASDMSFTDFDPLDCDLSQEWSGNKPNPLQKVSDDVWRTNGDTVERIELYAKALVAGAMECPAGHEQTQKALVHIQTSIAPMLDESGANEIKSCLDGLNGTFVEPGPSGAPTRGRLDCLPTGRNFYSVDVRAVPTPTAWDLGRRSADLVADRYFEEEGEWPSAIALTAWGTSNMRTGGDDIAQAMALIGVRPVWEQMSGRVTGFEIMTLSELKRPRIDVTLRISGFFRDAFPHQIDLFDSAVRAIGALDEAADANPIAAKMKAEAVELIKQGFGQQDADKRAGFRIFGSMPGAYGAGLQTLIDEGIWDQRSDFADSFLTWGSYAYGGGTEGDGARDLLETRLEQTKIVLQNQDNREHDILDSDDYYQFQGGLTAAVATLSGVEPKVYHGDHSRPETPKIRSLEEELARVVRSRAVNPKWIAGMMRHGYKGAFEMAATLDYLFAYAATTRAVKSYQFDMLHEAYFEDDAVRDFIETHNPAALKEMADRFLEAIDRGLWQPRRNSIFADLQDLKKETV
ncbi:MAG: cobaltochelatase subunit CobN [Hyphomicrobiales bacterium]|nr:MAG: cobaltochelatase subunit CobN [Hyphomicrobiales bacterium]